MHQLGFPSQVSADEVGRERTFGGSIDLCRKVAGLEAKQVQDELKTDKAQFSRWTDGKEGIFWPKLVALMDLCGNDAPLLWMNRDRGYDLGSMRRVETELERQNRLLREENAALRRVLAGGAGGGA